MSTAPRRPPRPSRPRSCHKDVNDDPASSAAADGTDVASCKENENDQRASLENISTQSNVSVNYVAAEASDIEATVEEKVVESRNEDCMTDMSTTELQTDRTFVHPEVEECGKTEAGVLSSGKNVMGVKSGVAAHTASTEVKFRSSPKSRKAPPLPPPPTSLSKDTRPLSADGDKSSEMLAVNDDDGDSENEPHRHVLRDVSPTPACSKSTLSSTSASNPDSKPALKPKPTVARESVFSEDVSRSSRPVNTSGLPITSNSELAPTSSPAAVAGPPVYAVVNKSQTLRSTSNVDSDASNVSKSGAKITVARSKSAVAAGTMPPKKPPRTFAHCEYMRLKSLTLPRSSEQTGGSDEIGSNLNTYSTNAAEHTDPLSKTNEDSVDGDSRQIHDNTETGTKTKEWISDDSGKELASKTKEGCFDASGKVKRRQNDKLPAPPRPPPPTFPDNRSSTLSSRSSVVDADTTTGAAGHKSQRPSLSLEGKQKSSIRPESESDAPDDDDDIYAVPGEVSSDSVKRNSDVSHGAARSRLSSSAASETTQQSLHPV